jgi:membrane-associated phospholipid phosphatase
MGGNTPLDTFRTRTRLRIRQLPDLRRSGHPGPGLELTGLRRVRFAVPDIATLAILIAVPFPTESAFLHFDVHDPYTVSTVSDYFLLRNGHARELAFTSAQGLISFPLLHAMLALYFAYSLRHVRLVFPIGIALNFLMILSTPTQGGHYLFDVLSGLIAGVLVIYFVRWLIRRSAPLSREVPLTFNT